MTKTDIMMIGHFAKDLLVIDGRVETSSGSGIYYGGIALGRLGVSVAVVTRLRAVYFHQSGCTQSSYSRPGWNHNNRWGNISHPQFL